MILLVYIFWFIKYIFIILIISYVSAFIKFLIAKIPILKNTKILNKVIIKELWEARADENHTEGITSFIYDEADPPEKRFMGILDSMIEHHGPYSHDPPCSKVNVIGAELTDQIRNFLSEYDFTKFEITKLGFTAEMTGQQDA